jgi:hypothetical protein
VFVPRLTTHLMKSLAGGLVIPAVVTLPLMLFCVLPVAGVAGGMSALRWAGLVLLGLLLLAGAVTASLLVRSAMADDVRWVDLRPGRAPTALTVRRGWRSSTIAVADLRRVTVVERHKLGEHLDMRVVLHTRTASITCEAGINKAVTRVDAADLTAWLAERLAHAGVEVECESVSEPSGLTVEHWWPAPKVATMWGVPVERVPDLAQQYDVRSGSWEPRAGALHNPGRTAPPHYNPDDVYRVAQARRQAEEEQQPQPRLDP